MRTTLLLILQQLGIRDRMKEALEGGYPEYDGASAMREYQQRVKLFESATSIDKSYRPIQGPEAHGEIAGSRRNLLVQHGWLFGPRPKEPQAV